MPRHSHASPLVVCLISPPQSPPAMSAGAGFGVLVSGCSTEELPSKQVLPQATAAARARAQDNEAAGVGARLPSSSSSSSTTLPGPSLDVISRSRRTPPDISTTRARPTMTMHPLARSLSRLDAALTGSCSLKLELHCSTRVQLDTLGFGVTTT